jgi:hypothetical protein
MGQLHAFFGDVASYKVNSSLCAWKILIFMRSM